MQLFGKQLDLLRLMCTVLLSCPEWAEYKSTFQFLHVILASMHSLGTKWCVIPCFGNAFRTDLIAGIVNPMVFTYKTKAS
jgi:hypothetical protein